MLRIGFSYQNARLQEGVGSPNEAVEAHKLLEYYLTKLENTHNMAAAYHESGLTTDKMSLTILHYPIPEELKTEPVGCMVNSCCGIAVNGNVESVQVC